MAAEDFEPQATDDGDHHDDALKIHVSRIPTKFMEESVQRILEEKLGKGTVENVTLIYKRPDEVDDDEENKATDKPETIKKSEENLPVKGINSEVHSDEQDPSAAAAPTTDHRGFGFVILATQEAYDKAIELQSVRGGRKSSSSKKHTLYIRPYFSKQHEQETQLCFLWAKYRCPYGNDCKFLHEGDGGCVSKSTTNGEQQQSKKKRQKCFAFKKGKCKKGDECPFSHDFVPTVQETSDKTSKRDSSEGKKKSIPDSEKDCINWKTKGKCRKGDNCPYKHDEALRKAALLKKKRKRENSIDGTDDTGAKSKRHNKQPLWVRVFGLNYETTQQDVRRFFESCGPIMEVEFPRFEDSGRSKGYCGVLFQSPKAVAKALELDGEELLGRWLRIQAGKMLLDQWEEREKQQQKQVEQVQQE